MPFFTSMVSLSSPRMWRSTVPFRKRIRVDVIFSIRVEVYLLRVVHSPPIDCFLHAGGGLPLLILLQIVTAKFSPFEWRSSDSYRRIECSKGSLQRSGGLPCPIFGEILKVLPSPRTWRSAEPGGRPSLSP